MRPLVSFVLLCLCATLWGGPMPAELEAALKEFRAEGPKGWSFIQTTESGKRSRVERFDPLGKNGVRWTLLKQDGREPTESETRSYLDHKSRRSSHETAPNVKDQIIPDTCEVVEETEQRGVYRFKLRPGDDDDRSAEHMRATFVLHRPSRTIEKVELASTGPFSPVLMVNVTEARTVMTYSLPEGDRPSLLKDVVVRIRGRAMWFRSLDQDMTVTYSDYHYAGKRPAPQSAN